MIISTRLEPCSVMELLHKYGIALHNHPTVSSFPKCSFVQKIFCLFVLVLEF
jgi:hypothetical protein